MTLENMLPANFRVGVCITTMHRPEVLRECLSLLAQCQPQPDAIIVSDDSRAEYQIAATRAVLADFPAVVYLTGPRRGVCANRNNALAAALELGVDCVSFLDDDTAVPTDFFAAGKTCYGNLSAADREKTIFTGSRNDTGSGPSRLNFRGYFEPAVVAETATVCAAFFPAKMLATERWDENIFFGSEDAEICLRAAARGFVILYTPTLKTGHLATNGGVLLSENSAGMTKYELQCEAARLYIGIKRYGRISPNPFKLAMFVAIYFAHMTISLTRRGLLSSLAPIVRAANLSTVFKD